MNTAKQVVEHWYDNKGLIGIGGALGGVLLKSALDLLSARQSRKSARSDRLADACREAFAAFLAAVDDWSDLENEEGPLDEQRNRLRWEAYQRVNRALATIDLLSPQEISKLATHATAVAHLPLEDPERIAAMEALLTALRKHLGIKKPAWSQTVAPEHTPPPPRPPTHTYEDLIALFKNWEARQNVDPPDA